MLSMSNQARNANLTFFSEAHDKIVVFVAEDRVLALQPTAERVEMFDLQMIDDQLPLIRPVAARAVEHKTTGKIWASETHRSIFFRLRTDSFSLDLTEEKIVDPDCKNNIC